MTTEVASAATDRLAQVHAQLQRAVSELRSGEDWAQMLEVQARFHNYSWGNCLLIRAACPHATRVAGYRTWQSLGRQVRKGERAIPILAPVVVRSEPKPTDRATSETDGERRVVRGFRIAYVFDVSATEGAELPEVRPTLLAGDATGELYERLGAQVREAGFALERADCSPANGSTDFLRKVVTLRPDLSGAQATKTLCHELAHVRLHAELAGGGLAPGACRGRAEVEAESVAYLVCAMAGIEAGSYSFPYVVRWATEISVLSETATRVTACARAVSQKAGLSLDEPELDAPAPARTVSPVRSRPPAAPSREQVTRSQRGRGR
jgi:antirestriction protein ArdC